MIWYAHVNEDNRAEREILLAGGYQNVYCVTGSAERALALMDAPSVSSFQAIDINPAANYLLEFKIAAIKRLSTEEYLGVCGLLGKLHPPDEKLLQRILEDVRPACREFWEQHRSVARQGVAHRGHFERFLSRVRPWATWILGRRFTRCFEQPYDQVPGFPIARWRLLIKLFSKRWVYRLMGNRDPAFVSRDGDPSIVAAALQRTLTQYEVGDSFMFHLIFRGNLDGMQAEHLPPSVRYDVVDAIRRKLSDPGFELHYVDSDLSLAIEGGAEDFSHSFFSISDILSFADFDYLINFLRMLKGANIAIVFRSFLRNGISSSQLDMLNRTFRSATDISDKDRTHMYRVYDVRI